MILESDSVWKEAIERKLQRLDGGWEKVANHFSLADVMEQDEDQFDHLDDSQEVAYSAQVSPHAEKHAPHNFEIVMDPDSGPAAIPGSVVSPVAIPVLEQNRADQDIITRGIVTLE